MTNTACTWDNDECIIKSKLGQIIILITLRFINVSCRLGSGTIVQMQRAGILITL